MPARLGSLRSLLFCPGNEGRKLARALASEADAVVADLEDSVLPSARADARSTVARTFAGTDRQGARMLRVNGAGTDSFDDDLALARRLELDAVVLPKASPEGVAALSGAGLPILAIVETARGVRDAYEIATCPAVFALMLGAVDLGAELGLEPRADGAEIHYARSKLVVDSAAAGIRAPFDSVHVRLRDEEGLEAQALLARALGLRGKACVHPGQIATVNRVFAPDAAEVEWAGRVIAAARLAAESGRGAVSLDGMLVDAPVVRRAQRIVGGGSA